MFGIGGQELVLLMLIGLIVLGPERLPRIAHQIGSWLGQARRMTRVMKRQLEEELELNKSPSIKPPAASRLPSQKPPPPVNADVSAPAEEAAPPSPAGVPRDDDGFSPAHGEEEAGTGVGEDLYDSAADLAVTEAERARSADDAPAAAGDAKEPATAAADKKESP